ncbi:VOC family protein [Chitinophaga sp. Cy-1792]|uniref:VOC family protein n=1 Tax=Chitinophaga sp. Cy-1792 TaxID=2608339 RepID=UPI0014233A1F|nr:VOC family protein [Chitinophaga sp. Cy-1792]NIG55092.1 glyoxalase/bleomycin resistance/extradiol dioxygenase family protein [Chitinophaga sp. Cy-1792]
MATLNLLVIKTDKPEQQVEFYAAIGFQFVYHQHGTGPFHYSSTDEGLVLEIYPLPAPAHGPDQTTRFGFTVPNLELTMQTLQKLNVTIVTMPRDTEWGRMALVQDMDGRRVELTEKQL